VSKRQNSGPAMAVNGGDRAKEARETARLEAFSDGVFAVAITILVFGISVPRNLAPGKSLLDALLIQWPAYLAFVTSFATIGIMWINHHMLFTHIGRSDHTLLVLNGLLLMGITFVTFPTAVVAEYINHQEQQTAAMLYSGVFTVVAVMFNLLWRHASRRLLRRDVDQAAVDAITRAYAWGPSLYFLSFLLASVSALASLGLNMALAVFFAVPRQGPRGDRQPRSPA
jgi:uncharacterized membrane protein